MSKTFKIGLVGVLVMAVMAVLMAGSALADQAAPALRANIAQLQGRERGGFGPGVCGQAGLDAAAEALDMTTDELSNQFWAGRNLADVADQAGVELQTIRDAVEAACQTARQEAIEQAVADGDLSREKADWLLEGLENGYMEGGPQGFGPGFGRGFGPGLDHGFGPGGMAGRGFPPGGMPGRGSSQ